jgi:hypothetical protein
VFQAFCHDFDSNTLSSRVETNFDLSCGPCGPCGPGCGINFTEHCGEQTVISGQFSQNLDRFALRKALLLTGAAVPGLVESFHVRLSDRGPYYRLSASPCLSPQTNRSHYSDSVPYTGIS